MIERESARFWLGAMVTVTRMSKLWGSPERVGQTGEITLLGSKEYGDDVCYVTFPDAPTMQEMVDVRCMTVVGTSPRHVHEIDPRATQLPDDATPCAFCRGESRHTRVSCYCGHPGLACKGQRRRTSWDSFAVPQNSKGSAW